METSSITTPAATTVTTVTAPINNDNYKPRVALITTSKFRKLQKDAFSEFVLKHLRWLLTHTELWTTAKTYDFLASVITEFNQNADNHFGIYSSYYYLFFL